MNMASNASQFQDVKLGKIPLAKDEVTPEEEQIQDALKHLDLLRARCLEIRTTIPEMAIGLQKVCSRRASPEASFGDLVNILREAGNKIQDFTTLYTNEESKKVFEQAWKSAEANPKGIKPLPQ